MADCLMITQNDGTAKPVGVIQGDASDIKYNNTTSGLTAADTQGAIDELATFDLLCTMTTANTEYNLSKSILNYKKLLATSYFVTGARDIILTSTVVEVSDINPENFDSVICCFNDGTVRKGQFGFNSYSTITTGADANWQNITKIKLWGIK